ncbi:hypothetical protein AZI86_13735 [Bdellovibrio bacteriovorus]|uniref:Uncharacterized protein n=1 Tax=Bdellovibrio bacteriovorus TaxID=959 RepID=A0A150WJX1_BDEBC|nr:hypothetical protein [Bdellovibrio bacteriovorus]KYG63875.1 hypothetical protein AZI86_13735 [Bdellovibrio bacteriovorus]
MKKALLLTVSSVLTFNSISVAFADQALDFIKPPTAEEVASQIRQQQLVKIIQEQGGKAALENMTREELIQAKNDLRVIVDALKVDLNRAEAIDGDKVGYLVRNIGGIGIGAGIVMMAVGVLKAEMAPGKVDFKSNWLIFFSGFLGTLTILGSTAVTATGQVMVWLTPSQATKVQERLDKMSKVLDQLEARLK